MIIHSFNQLHHSWRQRATTKHHKSTLASAGRPEERKHGDRGWLVLEDSLLVCSIHSFIHQSCDIQSNQTILRLIALQYVAFIDLLEDKEPPDRIKDRHHGSWVNKRQTGDRIVLGTEAFFRELDGADRRS